MAKGNNTEETKELMTVASVVVKETGEEIVIADMDAFRKLVLTEQVANMVTAKKLADFFYKLYAEMEVICRVQMDLARTDSTQVNQVRVGGVTVHLGAGKTDKELNGTEVEELYTQLTEIDPEGSKPCFETIHKVKKAEITKLRKQIGQPGSMERKRFDLIERIYQPAPKKLEIKGA